MAQQYQEASKQRKEATYEERREKALKGTRVLYLACPLCGRNRPLEMWGKETRFEVKPDYAIIQARYCGGRGTGFFLKLEESVTLEALEREYPEVYENLRGEVEKLYHLLFR